MHETRMFIVNQKNTTQIITVTFLLSFLLAHIGRERKIGREGKYTFYYEIIF